LYRPCETGITLSAKAIEKKESIRGQTSDVTPRGRKETLEAKEKSGQSITSNRECRMAAEQVLSGGERESYLRARGKAGRQSRNAGRGGRGTESVSALTKRGKRKENADGA